MFLGCYIIGPLPPSKQPSLFEGNFAQKLSKTIGSKTGLFKEGCTTASLKTVDNSLSYKKELTVRLQNQWGSKLQVAKYCLDSVCPFLRFYRPKMIPDDSTSQSIGHQWRLPVRNQGFGEYKWFFFQQNTWSQWSSRTWYWFLQRGMCNLKQGRQMVGYKWNMRAVKKLSLQCGPKHEHIPMLS